MPASYLMPMLAKVEGMPLRSLRGRAVELAHDRRVPRRARRPLVINVGFMVGHSAIRRVVMGEAANERAATDDELRR